MKLYEMTGNWRNLQELVENDEVPFEAIEEGLQDIESRIEEKFENISKFVRSLEGDVAIFKDEEKRLAARRKTAENKIKSLKDYMLNQLEAMEKDKIRANTFVIRKQKNPPSAEVYDTTVLSEDYLIPQEPKVDTKKILSELKSGKVIEGATFKPESYHLRIK